MSWQLNSLRLMVAHSDSMVTSSMDFISGKTDPEPDRERVERPKWFILAGICTHLGCVPFWAKSIRSKG